MGTISIFSLDLSGTRLSCARDFTGGYRLQAGDYTMSLTPDGADALAGGGRRIRTRANVASHFRREMKAGATFRRDLQAVDGRPACLEFGVSDTGDVFLEITGTRMTLTDQQAALLLAVLDTLGRDVATLYRSMAGPEDMGMGIAPGLRGPGLDLPDWADDTKWR